MSTVGRNSGNLLVNAEGKEKKYVMAGFSLMYHLLFVFIS